MSQQLTQNEWGFSIAEDNPFAIFTLLQEVAAKSVGSENVIDLSRGDPGYGFTPSERGRRFYSYLLNLDIFFNNETTRFGRFKREHLTEIKKDAAEFTKSMYKVKVAEDLLKDLDEFILKICEMAAECGIKWDEFDVLSGVFLNSAVSGGTYLNPQGEEISRVVLAHWYRSFIATPLDHDDFILTYGASHAIGTVFKALGVRGLNFINEKSAVLICSPVYAPYNLSLFHENIPSFVLSIDPIKGDLSEESLGLANNHDGRFKAIILIDPNNPTGFSLSDDALARIAEIAKKNDALIITDEVYTSFFPKKKTIVDYCPERTVRIDARSKIERSTGLRFGDMFISRKANEYITNKILKGSLPEGLDFKSYLMQAKGPGGTHGELQHTTFVPGPSQFLGIAHMVLAEEERERYFEGVRHNVDVFVTELRLRHKGNLYYIVFDMNSIDGCTKRGVAAEQKLLDLAGRGVVFLPANLFFAKSERESADMRDMVRASVVNTTPEKVERAARVTREYLTS
ncbi:pyridoxal phosphate-dependent aminotransferase [Patescibacteria group bacterium]|nr:pyridoxal phosphate-dependent aminotransferase [Patescibacteria group bacterium]MBU1703254.1 pyridoxal phosphate-dependent aminotransferase [Patescibacteria group bacterium]MBU1953766.1 pyridoxal phosphate-dependent aminotransferase [Patescibacteria group bacterium]